MKDIKAKILSNEEISHGYYKMTIVAPYIAKTAKPGQFVMVKCCDGYEVLLRRPFSIHRWKVEGGRWKGFEILYEVVGKGTELLSKRKEGDYLDVLGPLGNGFNLPSTINYKPSTILIAGGIGVAPLFFLAEKLLGSRVIVLIGAKTKKLILCERDFRKLGCEVHIATDDGSCGFKGFVSDLFNKILHAPRLPRTLVVRGSTLAPNPCGSGLHAIVYGCGPEPMLKSVTRICRERKLQCQVCLEEMMACGIGACLGCVTKIKSGNKLVCKDGPVFNADEIIW